MVKRKGRESKNTETLNDSNGGDDESRNCRSEDLEEGETSGFFACYLLTSLCPRYKGHTYIGFTVNPRRRIRQHNGELCSGATRTKRKRPWEMVLCIYGFPTNVSALQFEWAWQHPVESLAVRKAAVELKSLGGLASKIKLAYTMLTLPAWNNLNLNVNFFSTKYTIHYAGCPSLPGHMRVHIRSMDDLPCYTEGYKENEEDEMFRIENDFYDDDDVNDDNDDEDATRVLDSSMDHENNEEEATSISDSENLEDSPVRVPERPFMDYCSNLEDSPIIKNGNGNKICVSPVGGVEVIDLFSPSPEYRKKRVVFGDRPEIIDLTDSPICV